MHTYIHQVLVVSGTDQGSVKGTLQSVRDSQHLVTYV